MKSGLASGRIGRNQAILPSKPMILLAVIIIVLCVMEYVGHCTSTLALPSTCDSIRPWAISSFETPCGLRDNLSPAVHRYDIVFIN